MESQLPYQTPLPSAAVLNSPPLNSDHKPFQSKNHLFFKLFSLGLIFCFITGGLGYYFFYHTPKQAQAKEYLENLNRDFDNVQEQLIYFFGAFTNVSDSLSTSKEAFFEITTSNNYFEAVADTRQDIFDIQATLSLIDEAITHQTQNPPPNDFVELDQQVSAYYLASSKGLTQLLDFQQFQMSMLEASGEVLNTQTASFSAILSPQTELHAAAAYFTQVSVLAQEAVGRFEQITIIPPEHHYYYQTMLDYHKDLAQTSHLLAQQLLEAQVNGGQQFSDTLLSFSNRNVERNSQREADTRLMVEKSSIKTWFTQASALELAISSQLSALIKQYDIESLPLSLSPTPSLEASPSAMLSITPPIMELIVSPIASPTAQIDP